jgi:hypothetical protein
MSSSISSSSREEVRRFLAKLAIFVGLLLPLCMMAALIFNSSRFDGTYITAQNYKLAQIRSHPPYDLIVMGDSCPMAIDVTAPMTSARLGDRSIFNFALVNLGGVYPLQSTLKKYLSGGAAPRVILLSFLPSLLSGKSEIVADSRFTKFYAAKFYSPGEMISDPVLRAHPKLVGQLLFEKYKLRFMQYRYDIPRDDKMIRRLTATRGQLLVLEDTAATEEEVLASAHYQAEFKVSSDSDRYFQSFLALAKHQGVKVLLFDMPVPPSVLRHRQETGFYAAYFRYLAGVRSKFENLTYLDTLFTLPNEYFSFDVTHLNGTGAARFEKEQWPQVLDTAIQLLALPPNTPTNERGIPSDTTNSTASVHPGAISGTD